MPVDRARLEAIFGDALTKPDAAARAAYLDEACGGDAVLRARVGALLAAHEAAGDFLHLPSADANSVSPAVSEAPGTKIGGYKLLEQIGEGGFAVVFMAEQEQPVRRRVALKIIKLGMDTRQIVARFEAERQALAMMDHPSIAKVFDAGATESGRPYFVMELVTGIPITAYCDEKTLTIDQRLELFVQVCQAVQHAHLKGIIHRDIKPSNVLVITQDGRPLAKVIDFGIAKATQTPLTDKTLFTDFRQLIGTPAYMSPEQADGNLDIDTRSDVYSLGVLLYEIIAGEPPFDPKELRSKSFAEVQRIIREVDPPTLSTRVSSLAPEAQLVTASKRQTDPRRLKQKLRGDLDWIVTRSLEKDRKRRYQSASALAQDIDRYCGHLPIEAHQRAWMYSLRKWIRRNQAVFWAGSAIVVALMLGLALAVFGFMEARRQTEIARAQAARSEKVAQFLKNMLEAGGHPKADQLADLDRLFDDALSLDIENRLVRAVLLRSRGAVRAEIGQWDEALADCVNANQLALDGGIWSFDSAIVLLKGGREDEYRQVCHAYLQRAKQVKDFVIADMAAKVSLLLPVDHDDFVLACELADFAATETEPLWHLPCVHLGKALAEYRRGRFDSANIWAQRAMSSQEITPRYKAAAYFIQSCRFAQLRQIELARQALAQGDEMLTKPREILTKVFGDTWCDVAIAEHLRAEAAELIVQRAADSKP